jgi:hypothetical protein
MISQVSYYSSSQILTKRETIHAYNHRVVYDGSAVAYFHRWGVLLLDETMLDKECQTIVTKKRKERRRNE